MHLYRVRPSGTGYLVEKIGPSSQVLDTYQVTERGSNAKCSCESYGRSGFPHNHNHILIVRKYLELGSPEFCSFFFDNRKKINYVEG